MSEAIQELFFQHRVILITQPLTDVTAEPVIEVFHAFQLQGSTEPLEVRISSAGGERDIAEHIIDLMESMPCIVRTQGYGDVSSGAALILAAGTKGHRYLAPSAQVMMHHVQVQLTEAFTGHGEDLKRDAEATIKANRRVLERLARYCGKRYEQVERDTRYNLHLSAEEAVAYGFVDFILGPCKSDSYAV